MSLCHPRAATHYFVMWLTRPPTRPAYLVQPTRSAKVAESEPGTG
jgi:hypothetical protein